MHSRREFLKVATTGLAAAVASTSGMPAQSAPAGRRLRFIQMDVFASRRLQGNPLAVFLDGRGLADAEMRAIARETNLSETTFIFPRDPAVERIHGVRVRIFTPDEELPFAGHPTLGTAMVIRNRALAGNPGRALAARVILDLKVGKIPVTFTKDAAGNAFGEMRQSDPVFSRIHDRRTVADLLGIKPADISDDEAPIQTVSTGLPYAIVLLKRLETLRSLRPHQERIGEYFAPDPQGTWFYYATRDTGDPSIGLRSRGMFPDYEDPATGSAAGCTAAWMARYGIAGSGELIHLEQGVEIGRPSQVFLRADRHGKAVSNVRVGGNAVEIAEGDYSL